VFIAGHCDIHPWVTGCAHLLQYLGQLILSPYGMVKCVSAFELHNANKWQWWIVEAYLWLTAQVSWLGLKVASRLVVSLQSVFSKCTGQTLAVALSTELYILCWSELSRHKPSPTSATAHYSSPDGAIGLVSRCQLSRYVKLDYFLEAARLKFLHRPCNPAFVRCYVNMLTCTAINICKNKRFKGCGKTFLV